MFSTTTVGLHLLVQYDTRLARHIADRQLFFSFFVCVCGMALLALFCKIRLTTR
jgi:hypothetical protein